MKYLTLAALLSISLFPLLASADEDDLSAPASAEEELSLFNALPPADNENPAQAAPAAKTDAPRADSVADGISASGPSPGTLDFEMKTILSLSDDPAAPAEAPPAHSARKIAKR